MNKLTDKIRLNLKLQTHEIKYYTVTYILLFSEPEIAELQNVVPTDKPLLISIYYN